MPSNMEEITFNDWPGQDLMAAESHPWLPAYGFQTPSALLDRSDFMGNPDAEYFLQSPTHYMYLETIQEENSDDLHSESDVSDFRTSPLAWLNTDDSETGSVICIETIHETDCESDREIACPPKRRRQDNFLSLVHDEECQSMSRSSSLLQFETLEKQCQETSSSSPSIFSQFSYDSLDSPRKSRFFPEFFSRNNNHQKSSSSENSDTSSGDSEGTLEPSKSFTNLKTWRSFDSLPLTNPTNKSVKDRVSAENLSEDSGYSDNTCSKNRLKTTETFVKICSEPESTTLNIDKQHYVDFVAYDCEVFQNFTGNFGASYHNLSNLNNELKEYKSPLIRRFLTNWMKTHKDPSVNIENKECVRTSKYNCASASEPNLLQLLSDTTLKYPDTFNHKEANKLTEQITKQYFCNSVVCSVPKDLNLIGDFKCLKDDLSNTSVAAKNWDLADFAQNSAKSEMANYRREGSYAEAMTNRIDLSDDEHSLCYKHRPKTHPIIEFDKQVLNVISESISSLNTVKNDTFSECYTMSSQNRSVASTPNLAIEDSFQKERRKSLQGTYCIKDHSTSTSGMSDLEEKTLTSVKSFGSTNSRGVHFSPVVSEVNWHCRDESESTESIERESSYSLSSTPERDILRRPLPKDRSPIARFAVSQPNLNRNSYAKPKPATSQPDISKLKRRGSQLIQKDRDGCVIKAYVDGDGIQYKHTHLDLDNAYRPKSPSLNESHVACSSNGAVEDTKQQRHAVVGMESGDGVRKDHKTRTGKLGVLFSRLASFRFSNRKHDDKNKTKKKTDVKFKNDATALAPQQKIATKDDYIYIPLKSPIQQDSGKSSNKECRQYKSSDAFVNRKPPLPNRAPPRVVGASVKSATCAQGSHPHHNSEHQRRWRTIDSAESRPRPMEPMGLIETDLDTEVTVITNGANVKTRSLLNLGAEPRLGLLSVEHTNDGVTGHRPHKSMEFLLDKQNLKVVEPPENELQKGERIMSEHQLRVQRSLQKLNVPDWYKQSQVPREGFLLKKNREPRWTGTGSRTTSLSSLGSSNQSPMVLSPTYHNQPFVRWSTSKLNSTASSPCASTRSSFNVRQHNGSVSPSSVRSSFSYRQPYMGWRSQERLSKPRTPAERLANSLLSQNQVQENPEIQTSIKEVTSAIVHYVSGLRPDNASYDSQETASQRSRSASPRGSQKLCWLESSFVGVRPLDSPQTPSLSENPPATKLRLELQTHKEVNLLNTETVPKPSPGSTTLEDVLDSLLGLPSSDRAASPSLQVTASANTSPSHNIQDREEFRRRSEGSEPTMCQSRRVSFNSSPVLQCRYSRCSRIVIASTPEATQFKNCHNCSYTYCSRTCRRAHWEKHRKTCLFSRIGTLCRQVIAAAAKEQKDTLQHLSLTARRGYISHGLGAVKCFFSCPEAAERFLTNGLECLGELTYVCWPDLLPSEMGPQLYAELVRMCKNYNPDTKLVLYVSICVVSETPASGAVKWERQLVSRCAKMRLSKDLNIPEKEQIQPETLILTCNAIDSSKQDAKELKQISVDNVQKELKQRGISLRKQYPFIFKQLCNYASGDCDKFTPATVYSKDSTTSKSFMCIIMLEADPDSLRQVQLAGVQVRTINVLCQQ